MSGIGYPCRAVWCVVWLGLFGSACADGGGGNGLHGTAYYFPRATVCTVMVDFHGVRDAMEAIPASTRHAGIVAGMIEELALNGATKCNSAQQAQMLAVLIPGVDSYGRPDFGKRENLLKFAGPIAELTQMRGKVAGLELAELRKQVAVELYE